MKILLAASEVVGFAKTGGLADVSGSLPPALAQRGHELAVIMPYYRSVRYSKLPIQFTGKTIPISVGTKTIHSGIYKSTIPNSQVSIFFLDAPEYFDRDNGYEGRGLYQQTMPGGYKADYPDNAERFTFFSKAILKAAEALEFIPDIVHVNDWQTGLVPVYLSVDYRDRPLFAKTKSLFTIHNIAYQGMFGSDVMRLTGLPGWLFNHKQLEFHGHLNFMKAGIVFADAINTVSPTYSLEVQTAEYGCGLEGLLIEHRQKLTGIVNGVDYHIWNSATDPLIPQQYDITTVVEGKRSCKAELQKRFHIPVGPDLPVLGLVARLVSQKGIDIVLSAAKGILELSCQLVILGEGDREFHDQLQSFREQHPHQVGLYLGFHEGLAHLVEAGADLFLMPSRYEPSGLNQLYSMKYGTPPIVRATGGLADTVVNSTEENIRKNIATGFVFNEYSAHALYETVRWAVHLYRQRPEDFQGIVRNGMEQDWSWNRSAAAYEALYKRMTS